MRACVSEGWARVLGRRQPPHYVHVSCVKAGMAEAGMRLVSAHLLGCPVRKPVSVLRVRHHPCLCFSWAEAGMRLMLSISEGLVGVCKEEHGTVRTCSCGAQDISPKPACFVWGQRLDRVANLLLGQATMVT
eukprot:1144388-Pelagomonas_calceolata.AAC.7